MSNLIVVAGPNGSGKSTLIQKLLADGWDFGEYINPDEIARELAGGNYSDIKGTHTREAQKIADQRRNDCVRNTVSFSFETVMSHPGKVDFMREARSLGFRVYLHYVGVELPSLNVLRVQSRIKMGGHAVPTEKIISRYQRSMNLLPDAVKIAHYSAIYDNSSSEPGKFLPLIAEAQNGNLIKCVAAGNVGWIHRVFE